MTDNLARLILLAGFAIFGPVGIYHRFRARTDEKLDRRQEGFLILMTLRPLALAFMVGMITFLIKPAWMAWSAMPIPGWARWAGVFVGLAAACLFTWTMHILGRNLTDTVVTRRDAELVTTGPYRWVRHPFYTAFAFAVIANSLVTANAYLAIAGLVAFSLLVARTSIEERKLIDRFGQRYTDYMLRTGRFLPRLWR